MYSCKKGGETAKDFAIEKGHTAIVALIDEWSEVTPLYLANKRLSHLSL